VTNENINLESDGEEIKRIIDDLNANLPPKNMEEELAFRLVTHDFAHWQRELRIRRSTYDKCLLASGEVDLGLLMTLGPKFLEQCNQNYLSAKNQLFKSVGEYTRLKA